ncbi:MAG TPA: hypothetical protein VGQ94_00230 [Terriglobales bacterium]|nr:hypothetical protein [Terriglobales bacterium]
MAAVVLLAAFAAGAQTPATSSTPKQHKVLTEDDLARPSSATEQSGSEASTAEANKDKGGANDAAEAPESAASTDNGPADPKQLEADQKNLETTIANVEQRLQGDVTPAERDSLTDILQGYKQRLAEVKARREQASAQQQERQQKQGSSETPEEAPKEPAEEPPK